MKKMKFNPPVPYRTVKRYLERTGDTEEQMFDIILDRFNASFVNNPTLIEFLQQINISEAENRHALQEVIKLTTADYLRYRLYFTLSPDIDLNRDEEIKNLTSNYALLKKLTNSEDTAKTIFQQILLDADQAIESVLGPDMQRVPKATPAKRPAIPSKKRAGTPNTDFLDTDTYNNLAATFSDEMDDLASSCAREGIVTTVEATKSAFNACIAASLVDTPYNGEAFDKAVKAVNECLEKFGIAKEKIGHQATRIANFVHQRVKELVELCSQYDQYNPPEHGRG